MLLPTRTTLDAQEAQLGTHIQDAAITPAACKSLGSRITVWCAQAWRLTNDQIVKKGERPWISEMVRTQLSPPPSKIILIITSQALSSSWRVSKFTLTEIDYVINFY